MKYFLNLIIVVTVLYGCNNELTQDSETKNSKSDSVAYYLNSLVGKDVNSKKYLLKRGFELSKNEKNDSIKARDLLKVAFEAYRIKDSAIFYKSNKEGQKLAVMLKDTFAIADSHWNYGAYYGSKEVLDSSYYHYNEAYKNYEKIDNQFFAAKMLYNMAFIQSRAGDYANSETKIFQAIPKYKSLNKKTSLFRCYSLLGTIYKELEDYEVSLEYHNQALEYLKTSESLDQYAGSVLNNIGITNTLKENYNAAKKAFEEALNIPNIRKKNPKLFAKIYDNYGYALLKNNEITEVKEKLNTSLQIRENNNDLSGIVISKINIAQYYSIIGDTIQSINLASQASRLAHKTQNNRDILASLYLLSKLDKKNAGTYLTEHIAVSKEIESKQRVLREKFARIRFETDTYIDKSEKLSLQRYIIITASVSLLFVLSLLYYIRIQNSKNNELRLQKEQQEANEEIYKLLLRQQSKMEEGRLAERKRISEELHDGVLGKIFGTRMGLGFLDLSGSEKTKKEHEAYLNNLLDIEKEIRDISHQLKNDLLDGSCEYVDLLVDLIKDQGEIGQFDYKINTEGSIHWNQASDHIKINCYRITQEAIFNIIKHANANFVLFSYLYDNEKLKFSILDNGSGFDSSKTEKGIGLSNIDSRIESLKGTLQIESSNKGTSINITVPT